METNEMAKLPQFPANRPEQTGLRIHAESIRPKVSKKNPPGFSRTYVVTIRLERIYRHEVEIELTPAEYEILDARVVCRKVINAIAATSTICTVEPAGRVSHDQTIRDNWRHNATPELFDL